MNFILITGPHAVGKMTVVEKEGATTHIVELESNLETRIERNKHPHRLQHKPTKRNLSFSEPHMIQEFNTRRLNSHPREITHKKYLRINNENLSPEEVAEKIITTFHLPRL